MPEETETKIQKLKEIAIEQAESNGQDPEGIHGLSHWEMVGGVAAALLAANGHNPMIGRVFGLLHDCERHNDGHDPEHGERAAIFASKIRKHIPLGNQDFNELCEAMERHHWKWTASHPSIVGCCCDADRLDLGRVGIDPDSRFLASPQAKQLVEENQCQIITPEGTLVTLWHGSSQLEELDIDDGLRLRPNGAFSPIYLTENPEICHWYGPAYKVLLLCKSPTDVTDIGSLLRKPVFEHLKEVEAELKSFLPESYSETGEPFCLFDCLENGSMYHELNRNGSEEVVRSLMAKGYDAIRFFDDGRAHFSEKTGESVPTWVTFNTTNSILIQPRR